MLLIIYILVHFYLIFIDVLFNFFFFILKFRYNDDNGDNQISSLYSNLFLQ